MSQDDTGRTRRLGEVVRIATGRTDAVLARWACRPLDHRVENMTTERLERYAGTLDDGAEWSVVAKTVRPASEHPAFATIPPEFHAQTLAALDWRDEPRVYRCGLRDTMHGALRMPAVHAIDETTDRITIWMEDLADTTPWDLDRFRRTAHALAQLAGEWRDDRATRDLGFSRRCIADLFFGKIHHVDLPVQSADEFWQVPAVADVVDDRHRDDLFRLADRMPAMIGRLDGLPTGLCHGDATPDNFREPGDGSIVGLDWAYANVDALGSDLGQLLVGRIESGASDIEDVDDIGAVAGAIMEGYAEGLGAAGVDVDLVALERAWATHLAIRSVFSALVVDHRPDLDAAELAELTRRRAAMGRFGLDLALRHS